MNICFLDAITLGDVDFSAFNKFGNITIHQTTQPSETAARIKDQDVVISNKVLLNESNIKDAHKVKLICVAATGTNNVDLVYAKSREIVVTNVSGYSTNSVAQHTFSMLFYLIEQLSYYDQLVKTGEYTRSGVFTNLDRPYWEIKGKTWGIIGLGNIGRTVASIADAFGCRVIYYSTSGQNNNSQYTRVDIEELMQSSDIVSIHSPLNENTKNLITYEQIKLMQKHAILLNLGRGTIVNETDLAKALDDDLIYGAGLDVLESEPINAGNPLLNLKNPDKLLITPHIAWASIEARKTLVNEIYLNIDAYKKGESRNRVN